MALRPHCCGEDGRLRAAVQTLQAKARELEAELQNRETGAETSEREDSLLQENQLLHDKVEELKGNGPPPPCLALPCLALRTPASVGRSAAAAGTAPRLCTSAPGLPRASATFVLFLSAATLARGAMGLGSFGTNTSTLRAT